MNDYSAKIQITESLIWELFPLINPKIGFTQKQLNIKGFVYTFNKYANYFAIDTFLEVAHFLTQVGHESDQFNAFEEYASGNAYDTRTDLGNTKQVDGDGRLYKGRGPIQNTGRRNYIVAGNKIYNLPFLNESEKKLFANNGLLKRPELLKDPVWGTLAALIYWTDRDLNSLCTMPPNTVVITVKENGKFVKKRLSSVDAISYKVNGGWNGIAERRKNFENIRLKLKF